MTEQSNRLDSANYKQTGDIPASLQEARRRATQDAYRLVVQDSYLGEEEVENIFRYRVEELPEEIGFTPEEIHEEAKNYISALESLGINSFHIEDDFLAAVGSRKVHGLDEEKSVETYTKDRGDEAEELREEFPGRQGKSGTVRPTKVRRIRPWEEEWL